MRFEWDEEKRQSNLEKHGIDFIAARHVFDGRARVDSDSPRDGEERTTTTARLNDLFITVVWTWRGDQPGEERVRIISARRARSGEEQAYRQLHG